MWPNAEYELSGTKALIRICPWLEPGENWNDPRDVEREITEECLSKSEWITVTAMTFSLILAG